MIYPARPAAAVTKSTFVGFSKSTDFERTNQDASRELLKASAALRLPLPTSPSSTPTSSTASPPTPTTASTFQMASSKLSFPSASPAHASAVDVPSFPNLLPTGNWFYTTAAIILSLLILEQSVYRFKKRHLPGDKWTIPIIGKFADSMKPTMEGYMKQWDSGALSALSVFNMYVATFVQ